MMKGRTIGLVIFGAALLAGSAARGEGVSYSREVRPILSKNCFKCHGPDEETLEGETRLDVAGEADLKAVLGRITTKDPDDIMPPPSENKTLTEEEIAVLKQWVKEGAEYEEHWAFVLPKKVAVPAGVHAVDYFIDAELEKEGRERSEEADPYTLIRRVSLDLIGLPPTVEEADAFAANPTEEAYEAVVDRLLASPQYGERWARRWLDLARYADTNGYEKDRDRSMWPWRDWVIRSINNDQGFDQFTIEQIAGDLLPKATVEQIVATGFHRNTMLNEEGGIDPLEFRFHAMTDRVGTTGTTWLGLTTSCAQCHTHKYDPITHRDYYGMMAYMDNTDEPDYFLPVADAAAREEKNRVEAEKLLGSLAAKWPEVKKEGDLTAEEGYAKWLEVQKASVADWRVVVPAKMEANVPFLNLEEGGVVFVEGDTSKHDVYTLEFPAVDHRVDAIRLEALPDVRLPGGGPGMTYYEGRKGVFFLSEFQVSDAAGKVFKVGSASDSGSGNGYGGVASSAEKAVDGDIQTGWSIAKITGRRQVAVFNLAEPIPAGTAFSLRMDFGRHFSSSLGKFRVSAAEASEPVRATTLPAGDLAMIGEEGAEEVLWDAFLMDAPQLKDHAEKIRNLRKPVVGPATLVMRERPVKFPRSTYLRHRGEYTQPKDRVLPRLPAVLWADEKTAPKDRLGFAKWLVSRKNPLTARVVANRQWAAFFGTGIVKTLDDFGMQGELPSHPELLDWLAVEFMDRGWSRKQLHRLIVTSATYKQDSAVHESTGSERDLARFVRVRLEAEIIRDAALKASGLLSGKMYGAPVRPPQPAGAVGTNYRKSKWPASKGEDRFRRSLYTYQLRTAPFAMALTFDAGSGEACVAKRDVSNTPLQALTLLNDPMFMEISKAFGESLAKLEGDVDAKLTEGFRRVLTRPPGEGELDALRKFHAKHEDWGAVARVLLCLDETITKN